MSREDFQKVIENTIIKYKDIIFSVDSSINIKFLNEPRKQQVTEERVHNKFFLKETERKLTREHLK